MMSEEHREQETILIVENNADMRLVLETELEENYEVLLAENGRVGMEMAVLHVPDLVIADIMMPIMSGIGLCKELKENEVTNHIPVVMLTARGKEHHQIEGLEVGANDYISKPFSVPILKMRIHNLLESMSNYRMSVLHELEEKGGVEAVPFKDPFMKRIVAEVGAHLDDAEFGVKQLAEKMKMSERTLQRKLKAMIDKTPQDMIRFIRLQRAHAMLTDSSLSISEIAFKVGFQEPSNFSRSFKGLFGVPPSGCRKEPKGE